ncbi:hypothetical protein [Sphingomonas sp. BAUL-RG-20F-R05-02]|uniref:hypothetical protein n=1 Tax=Sphingomonas sp. BAUL-RG-20F-R05-02 TaxID=2914830 RepID=UPI001F5602F7|nr:hypothetical protein [Sphingomonas sp. BAUL-RG-20F-R05-02]
MAERKRHPDPQGEINAIWARCKGRPMPDAERERLRQLDLLISQRKTRLHRQIKAAEAKVARLKGQLHA